MKRIELGEKSYIEIKESVSFGKLLEAMDTLQEGKTSVPLKIIIDDMVQKVVIDGEEKSSDYVFSLDSEMVGELLGIATEALTRGTAGLPKAEKKE